MAINTLVTCIGASAPGRSYVPSVHRFPCGTMRSSSFVGFSLLAHGAHDRLVVLGTHGSHWHELCHGHPAEGDAELEQVELRLLAAQEQGVIPRLLLAGLEATLARALGIEVSLELISECVTDDEQQALLATLVQAVDGSDRVSIDITHGYRHLPMLLMMAALCLRSLRPGLCIEQIWYARLLTDRTAPEQQAEVHNLGGVLHFADWLAAMQDNAQTGGYTAVARLVENPNLAQALTAAGFYGSIHQDREARSEASRARALLQASALGGAGRLFQPQLEAQLGWFDNRPLFQRQGELARQALGRGDFLRAAMLGFEAYLSRRVHLDCGPNTDASLSATREATKQHFEDGGTANQDWSDYVLLRDIRNALAHGGLPRSPAGRAALASSDAMQRALHTAFRRLLPAPAARGDGGVTG
jgi:CRISPR-associated Csx2 family protein